MLLLSISIYFSVFALPPVLRLFFPLIFSLWTIIATLKNMDQISNKPVTFWKDSI